MQNNFIECKEEQAHRGHQEQPLRCSGGVRLPGLQRNGGRPTGPSRLALSGADRKGREGKRVEENSSNPRG